MMRNAGDDLELEICEADEGSLDLEVDADFFERVFRDSPTPRTRDGGAAAKAEPRGALARWGLALPWRTRRRAQSGASSPAPAPDRLGDELSALRAEIRELRSRVDGSAETFSKELPLLEGRFLHLIEARFQQLDSELELQSRRVAEQSDRGLRNLGARSSTLLSLVLLVLLVILFRL